MEMKNQALTAIIVDDEEKAIETLAADLKDYPDVEVVATFTSLQKAKAPIIRQQPDLLFLDVEFPQGNGFELLQSLQPYLQHKTHVIFYSAFDRYMIDALRASAFDFLLKPYNVSELETILERVKCEIVAHTNHFELALEKFFQHDGKFAVQTISRLLLLRISEILCFKYMEDQRSWSIVLTNNEQHRLRSSAKAEDILGMGKNLIRIHSNCILNIDYLASVENKTLRCQLYPPFDEMELYASRRYYSKIKEAIQML